MLKNISIRARLIAVLAFLCTQVLVGAVVGITSLGMSNEAMRATYEERLVPTGQLDQVVRNLQDVQLVLVKAFVAGSDENRPRILRNMKTVEENWAAYMAGGVEGKELELAQKFEASLNGFQKEGMEPSIKGMQDFSFEARDIVFGRLAELAVVVDQDIDALIAYKLDSAKAEFERSQATYIWVRNTCIAAVIGGMLLAIFVGIWLVRAICRPLDTAVVVASSVASGDLTHDIRVHGNDETGRMMRALREMNASLASIVSQVRTGVHAMTDASDQIVSGNDDLSVRTEQQASSLEQTAASMEELTSTVKQNADNARQANQLALTASEVATRGGDVVGKVVEKMESINASSRKVVDIIGVIDSIAFQTNILALNAAVEAARAGEQGRGFAVVASEVRNLAHRSASAAKEIKLLIDTSVSEVDAGRKLVGDAGSTMEEIVSSIHRVTDIMGEITAASAEQTSGIEQVNQAIAQMDQTTQQNASLVQEAAAAAHAMQQQAQSLLQAVSVFRIQDGADAHAGSALMLDTAPTTLRIA